MKTQVNKGGLRVGRACVLAAAVVAISGGSTTAVAQSGLELEEVVVTAQRRTESLMDVPIPITAIDGEAITRQQIQGIEDILQQVPNVSFVSQGSRDRKEISIRGVSNQLDPYRENRQLTYAMYIDDFNVAVGMSNPEVLDLERIEVLRGPQGTYFGRNAIGGAINVTTKKPDNTWFSEIGFGYGNYNTRRGHFIANVPVVEDRFALRFSGQKKETDGWIKNINPTGGGNDGEFTAARIQARFTPNERITWDFAYNMQEGEEGMRVGVPTGFLTATWRAVYYQNQPGNIANPDGIGFYPENRRRANFNTPQEVGQEVDYFSSRFVYEFDTMNLTAVAGKLDSLLFNRGDIDGGSLDAFNEYRNIDRDSESFEVRLQSNQAQRLEWSIGAITGKDTGDLSSRTYHGRQSPLGGAPGLEVTGAEQVTTFKYQALFGQLIWNISDQFKLILGGRYSEEDVASDGVTRSNTVVTGRNNRVASFDDFSPRVTLSYAPEDLGLFYATISKGFKAGGTQTTGAAQLRNQYDPEELWNYELGWKAELMDRRLRVDVAAFYMDREDVQQFIRFQFIDPNTGLLRAVTGIDNASSATSKGIEASIEAVVAEGFRLGTNIGYLDASYGHYPNALIDGQVINASGKRLINAPRWTVGAYADYTREVFTDWEGFVRAEYQYRSSQLSNTFALRYEVWPFIAPSYDVVNLRAGIGDGRWQINAYVENLFDQDYFVNSFEQAFYSGVQVEPSIRSIGVELRYIFGGEKR